MDRSQTSASSPDDFERSLREELRRAQELYLGEGWRCFQADLRRVRARVVDRAVQAAQSSPPATDPMRLLAIAGALDLLLAPEFAADTLEAARQLENVDSPEPSFDAMPLDSEGRARAGEGH